jgi:hypothetical protein
VAEERWLSFQEAVDLFREQLGCSIGLAQSLVRKAHDSGEVRTRHAADHAKDPVVLLNDDGVVGMDMRPGALIKCGDGKLLVRDDRPLEARRISKDDLVDWLNRNVKPQRRKPDRGKKETSEPGPVGRPETYDYDEIKGHCFRLFKQKKGIPDRKGDEGWRTQADLAREIGLFCQRLYGQEPADSRLKIFANRAIKDWKAYKGL